MRYNKVIDTLQNLIDFKPTQGDIAKILGVGQTAVASRKSRQSEFTFEELRKIESAYSILGALTQNVIISDNSVQLNFYPEVYLSAGYGVTVIDEKPEQMVIDSRLLISDKGIKINPELCEVVMISGNSMSPEYRHGDRVIIDKGDTELADGHIFAFRYKGQCYVKEINLLGNKIKCISINKEYDPFYIDENEDFQVFGRIIPRIRL
jgi:phage repressor protein C with HTH and peptisase S24 domain